ncbi:MAG: SPOR domain-containing protein [Flavobacteriales bacterium]
MCFSTFVNMRLDRAIADLLYRHDCVIIPDFGGFITGRIGAKPMDGCFHPPRKEIYFNEALQSQDGLLVNHIAQQEQIAFEAAVRQVEMQTRKWKRALSHNRYVRLKGIGTLSSNAEQSIQFKPDQAVNYLTESFGLPSTYAEKRLWKSEKRAHPWLGRARYAALWVPLAALSVFSIYKLSKQPAAAERDEATLNPFVAVSSQNAFSPPLEKLSPPVFKVDLNSDRGVVNKSAPPINRMAGILPHQLIAGAFIEMAHAQRLLADLKRQGYKAQIVGKSGRLTLVAVETFASKHQALRAYYQIRKALPEIWYRYKG